MDFPIYCFFSCYTFCSPCEAEEVLTDAFMKRPSEGHPFLAVAAHELRELEALIAQVACDHRRGGESPWKENCRPEGAGIHKEGHSHIHS